MDTNLRKLQMIVFIFALLILFNAIFSRTIIDYAFIAVILYNVIRLLIVKKTM